MSVGGLSEFLDVLLIAESGLDPSRTDWYEANLDKVVLRYWAVSLSGEILRDSKTGSPILEDVTVAQYFDRLGVRDLANAINADAIRRARYAATNPWGFIGYQLGEALLLETGHYEAERVVCLDEEFNQISVRSFYSGDVSNCRWANGKRLTLHRPYQRSEMVLAAHVNQWRGTFTGLDGLCSLADLKTPCVQERVFIRILRHNCRKLLGLLDSGIDELKKRLTAANAPNRYTLSGCLAACHLCGVEGTSLYLLSGQEASDETGTTLSSYMRRFSGFSIERELFIGEMIQ